MRVRVVETAADLREFVSLPYRLHRAEPLWTPPLRFDVRQRLSRRHNPFFDHGQARHFLAEREGKTIGRISAISNRLHDETHHDATGFFGFFECADDAAAARALFDAAADWVRGQGYAALRGPVSFSTNDECGLLVEGLDTPATLLTTWNPAYYVRLVENAGFRKAADLFGFRVGDSQHEPPVAERLNRMAVRLAARHGAVLRPIARLGFARDVRRLRDAYNTMWEHNWGFVPMTDREIRHMAQQLRPLHVPELVPMAEKDGELVGFGLVLPDLNQALRPNRSGNLFTGLPRVIWELRRRRLSRVRVVMLGVLPEYRNRGLDASLWHWIWTRATRRGVTWAEASWILEDNPAMCNAATRMGFVPYKRWRLYDRPA